MASQQDKNLEAHLLTFLERRICIKACQRKPHELRNHTNFGSKLQKIVLNNILVFFPILEKIYQATRFQHGVELAKAKKEAADAKLAMELNANEQEGERAAKRRRTNKKTNDSGEHPSAGAANTAIADEDSPRCGKKAGQEPRRSSVSPGGSRANSRSSSPGEATGMEQQAAVPIETEESSRMAATRPNGQDASNLSLFLNDEESELAITTAVPPALATVKETWDFLGDPRDFRRAKFDCEGEQDMVLSYVIRLDFFTLGPDLVRHFSRRGRVMSQSEHQPSVAELAKLATSQETTPFQRFKALKSMTGRGHHDWIQRVYGEILLWESVQAEVEKRSDTILLTRRNSNISEHQTILKKFAKDAAEKEGYKKQKEIDGIIKHFERRFYSGLKWRNVTKDFKGSGIIIAFIVAGFCASLVSSTLTEYQRRCLANLSGRLPKIGRLVQLMGEDALQVYCETGCLPPDRFVNVEEFVKEHTGFEINDDV